MNDDMTQKNEEGIVQRLRESPRTVSALVIILIAAAAIYAFSGREEAPEEVAQDGTVAVVNDDEEVLSEEEEEEVVEEEAVEEEAPATPTTTEKRPTTPADDDVALPEPSRTEQGFVEVAQRGEGVTHLARRAAEAWLEENQADYEVTKEHRIYIEDYIQKRTGNQRLEIGEQVAVNFDLIEEAVDSASELTDNQLRNLSQYTHVLP